MDNAQIHQRKKKRWTNASYVIAYPNEHAQ